MPIPLPHAIRVQAIRDDASYSLPARPLGNLRWIALFLAAFGVVFALIPAITLFRTLKGIMAGKSAVPEVGFAVFLAPALIQDLEEAEDAPES